MPETIKVATANTFQGRMLEGNDGIEPFAEAQVDIIALQEIRSESALCVLEQPGFTPVLHNAEFGLVLALSQDSDYELVPESEYQRPLDNLSGRMQRAYRRRGNFAVRGLIACKVRRKADKNSEAARQNGSGHKREEVCMVTSHPYPAMMRRARTRQVLSQARILNQPYFRTVGGLVFMADQNQFPNPGPVDHTLTEQANLTRVDIGSEPTWARLNRKGEPSRFLTAQLDVLLVRDEEFVVQEVKLMPVKRTDHYQAIVATLALRASEVGLPENLRTA